MAYAPGHCPLRASSALLDLYLVTSLLTFFLTFAGVLDKDWIGKGLDKMFFVALAPF